MENRFYIYIHIYIRIVLKIVKKAKLSNISRRHQSIRSSHLKIKADAIQRNTPKIKKLAKLTNIYTLA